MRISLVLVTVLAACGTYEPQLLDLAADGHVADPIPDAGASPDSSGPAALLLDRTASDFGDVVLGASSMTARFTVTNVGASPSGALALRIDGDEGFVIAADGCGSAPLAPGAACAVDVGFAPHVDAGARRATVVVAASPGGERSASLSGKAISRGPMEVDDDTHGFGVVKVAAQSPPRSFVFTNAGNADTGALVVRSSDPDAFAVTTDGCTGQTLGPAETCSVAVRFTPRTVGSATGSVTVTGDPGGAAVVALGGQGFAIVTVTRSGSGTGAVVSLPAGIDCGAMCELAFTTPLVTLNAAPGGTAVFSGWSGDCSGTDACALDLDAGDAVVSADFAAMQELRVTRTGTSSGSVTSSPGGIACGEDCTERYHHGTSVQLTASPAPGTATPRWTGCDTSTGNQCTVTMSAARSVGVAFDLQALAFTASKTGAGSGTLTSTPAGIACGSDCTETWNHGTAVTLSAAPANGSRFVRWTGCDSTSGSSCTVTVDGIENVVADFELESFPFTVTRTGTGSGSVTSNPGGILCGSDCTEPYAFGSTVTLTASAGAGSTLVGWTGCDQATGPTCTVTVDGAESVSADFRLGSYPVTVTRSGGGAGSVSSVPSGISCGGDCSETWAFGTPITLTATPAGGSTFAGWSGCDSTSGLTCTLTVTGDENVSAAFEPQGFLLGVTRSGTGTGTVSSSPAGISCGADCSNSYAFGTEVTLTATPAAGSTLGAWGGCDAQSGPTCTVTIDAAESVTVEFTLQSFPVTVTKAGAGSGTVTSSPTGISCGADCTETFSHGATVTLTATPAAGSTFSAWTGCDAPAGNTCVVTVSGAENVTATFGVTSSTLTVATTGNGAGVVKSVPAGIDCGVDCSETYGFGTSVVLTATPQTSSFVASWVGCDSVAVNSCTVSVTSARTVTARFDLKTFDLVVGKLGNGAGSIVSDPAGIDCGDTCTRTSSYGTVVTLTASAAVGSSFTGWQGCDSSAATSCTITMTTAKNPIASFALKRHQVTVAKAGNGAGTVTSNPAGISCGGVCGATWDYGTTLTLTAAPSVGSTFSGWQGCASPAGTSCTVTVDSDEAVIATFTLATYAVSVTRTGSGTVTSTPSGIDCGSDCSETWNHGTSVTFTATPAAPSRITWSGCTASGNTCTLVVGAIANVGVTFTPTQTLSLTKSGSGTGTVTSDPVGLSCGTGCASASVAFDQGTSVRLTASAPNSAVFSGWGGACSSSSPTCDVAMTQARSVTATFMAHTLNLSITAGDGIVKIDGVDCDGSCSTTYPMPTDVQLRAVPDDCFVFDKWIGCPLGGNPCTVTVNGVKFVEAKFAPVPHCE